MIFKLNVTMLLKMLNMYDYKRHRNETRFVFAVSRSGGIPKWFLIEVHFFQTDDR